MMRLVILQMARIRHMALLGEQDAVNIMICSVMMCVKADHFLGLSRAPAQGSLRSPVDPAAALIFSITRFRSHLGGVRRPAPEFERFSVKKRREA